MYHNLFLIITISFLIIFCVLFNVKIMLSPLIGRIIILILLLAILLLNNIDINFFIFNYLFVCNTLNIFIQNILFIVIILCIFVSFNYLKYEKFVENEYFILLILSFIGIISIVQSNDFSILYLSIELQSLAFYILASFKVQSNYSTEASLKYFILGALSSGLLLFGCSLIYGFLGTTNFYDLQLLFINKELSIEVQSGFFLGIIFLIIGFFFKLGIVPFHMWLPDVYEGVPTVVTLIFALLPKIALISILLKISTSLFLNNDILWNQMLMYGSIFSVIIGTLGALYQFKIKRLLAYSTISHTGFLLMSFSLFDSFSLFATFFYLIVYIIISLNIFTLILSIRKFDNFLKIKKINEFVILFKSNPLLAFNFCIILFSIGGIPPLIGFYSKYYVFISLIKYQMYLLVLILIFFSVLASLYYLRLIKLMFFKKFDYWIFLIELSWINAFIISFTLLLNFLFVFYPDIFLISIYNIIFEIF